MKTRKGKTSGFDIAVSVILAVCALFCLLPILHTLAISFSDRTSVAVGEVFLLPHNFNVAAYQSILSEKQFLKAFWVSVKRVVIGGGINMLLSVLMAYPLSKNEKAFPKKNRYLWVMIFTMLFNGGLVPSFLLIKNLKLMDTIWALVLPTAVNVFNTIILMNFFKGIPRALEDAAMVDGANPLQILWSVYLPLSKAPLATISLFVVVNHWNAFFDGKIFINSADKIPLQTYIQALFVDISPTKLMYMSKKEMENYLMVSNLTFNSAKVIVSMLPILAVYPFLQKYFVTGLVMGAVKE